MAKMVNRNAQLKSALGAMAPKERVIEAVSLPKEDTVNIEGVAAYSYTDEYRLITMLNTLKLQPQFYRSESQQMKDLRDTLEKVALRDPYFAAQCIVWSRCLGEGMRTINHLAAVLLAPFISGQEFAKRFYSLFDKKGKKGGCIFRVDDMVEIKEAYSALNNTVLANAMKKGFKNAIENLDTYQLAKYSKAIIDLANLVHPDSKKSNAEIEVMVEGQMVKMKTLDALMKGFTVTPDTWEAAQSEAGQMVAQAVKEGKVTKEEGEKMLAEQKADNWESLLKDGKLGIMAALRNIRNILKNPRREMVEMWCQLISDQKLIQKGLILPIHFDLAYEVVASEFARDEFAPVVMDALQKAYMASIPNLAAMFTGKTLVVVDCSGSMGTGIILESNVSKTGAERWRNNANSRTSSCSYKAGLIAATLVKATGADVLQFGDRTKEASYNKNESVFELAKTLGRATMGGTSLHTVFEFLTRNRRAYNRIIILSDNAINGRVTSSYYSEYIRQVCSPYIYTVDLAGYGTTPLKNEGKVSNLCGYGPTLFNAIASQEFKPEAYIDEIRKIVI